MNDISIIRLDDGKEYYLVDNIVYNNVKYILLSFVSDVKDICIRKMLIENGEEIIAYLEEDEFDTIFNMFYEKNKALIN